MKDRVADKPVIGFAAFADEASVRIGQLPLPNRGQDVHTGGSRYADGRETGSGT